MIRGGDAAEVLVVVDQPNNIGRLTVTVTQAIGADVHYLPGLAIRQLSRIHVSNSKTDIRNTPTSSPMPASTYLMPCVS